MGECAVLLAKDGRKEKNDSKGYRAARAGGKVVKNGTNDNVAWCWPWLYHKV